MSVSEKLKLAEDEARCTERDQKGSLGRKRGRGMAGSHRAAKSGRRSTLTNVELDELMRGRLK